MWNWFDKLLKFVSLPRWLSNGMWAMWVWLLSRRSMPRSWSQRRLCRVWGTDLGNFWLFTYVKKTDWSIIYHEQIYHDCAYSCPPLDFACVGLCARDYEEGIQGCPCQSGCPLGCPCDNYCSKPTTASTTTALTTSSSVQSTTTVADLTYVLAMFLSNLWFLI